MIPDREKVVKGLEECNRYGSNCKVCPYYDPEDDGGCHAEELMLDALALLKVQEPKKIIRKQAKRELDDGGIEYYAEWFCPHCNSLLVRGYDQKWIKYCPRCGKALEWDD